MRLLIIIAIIGIFNMGHAPWGQHHVYRQIHMLILCDKKDVGSFEHTKNLVAFFNDYLPEAKARVARAPHEERIIALLQTNQIPLALISYKHLKKITNKDKNTYDFFSKETRVLFFFSEAVLISNNTFPIEKSAKIVATLMKGSKKRIYRNLEYYKKSNYFIPSDESIK